MRLLLSGGSSGGHILPGLSVAAALRSLDPEGAEFLYVGTRHGVESMLVPDADIPFAAVSARPLRGRHPLSQLWSCGVILIGIWQARAVLRRFRPHAVFVTGGYASVPVGVAAWLRRVPLVLFLPDIEPGWAVRLLARLATRICVTDAHSLPRLPGRKAVATGYPLRAVFREIDRPRARARFRLDGRPAVLITGAVQGAERINRAVAAHLDALLDVAHVIHVTGIGNDRDHRVRREALPPALQERYQIYDYLGDDLPIAMAACDLAVSRAGAAVLGEFPAAGLPAVLVPLPAGGGLQRRNAAVLAQAGAALVVDDRKADSALLPATLALLRDPERLESMRRAAQSRARLDGAERIAEILWEVRQ